MAYFAIKQQTRDGENFDGAAPDQGYADVNGIRVYNSDDDGHNGQFDFDEASTMEYQMLLARLDASVSTWKLELHDANGLIEEIINGTAATVREEPTNPYLILPGQFLKFITTGISTGTSEVTVVVTGSRFSAV